MYLKTRGLVVRETDYKDADRILTVLSENEGKLTVTARSSRRVSNKCAAATQHLCYSEMVLFHNRGRLSLNEAEPIEQLLGLRDDINTFSLGAYFAEVLEALSDVDKPDAQLLRLGLNSLYALSGGIYPHERVKAGFEMRAACISGYEPDLDCCACCGKRDPPEPMFNLSGRLHCRGCNPGAEGRSMPLCQSSLDALRYIITADIKRFLMFSLVDEKASARLAAVTEAYLFKQTERSFSTLDFYKFVALEMKPSL